VTYAHCVMAGDVPEHLQDDIAESLLKVISSNPLLGCGVYVVVVASNVHVAKANAWNAVIAGFDAGSVFESGEGM